MVSLLIILLSSSVDVIDEDHLGKNQGHGP